MPKRNVRGGKGFKKGRKDGGVDRNLVAKFEGKDAGQLYGRVITVLGNRRFKCFCDDGQERICKLRGLLCWGPRRQRVEIGDIVLLSERSFDGGEDSETEGAGLAVVVANTPGDCADISDIITKIPQQFWRDIRRAGGIHPDFFGGLSLADPTAPKKKHDDDIFDGSDDDNKIDGDGGTDAVNTIQHKRDPKWSATVEIDSDGVEDFDVDAI
jgi:translation initiation factor IF-1